MRRSDFTEHLSVRIYVVVHQQLLLVRIVQVSVLPLVQRPVVLVPVQILHIAVVS